MIELAIILFGYGLKRESKRQTDKHTDTLIHIYIWYSILYKLLFLEIISTFKNKTQ